jgi:hypothetical protein
MIRCVGFERFCYIPFLGATELKLILSGLLILMAGMFFVGLFAFFAPTKTIELQKKFYAKINWKIEPISMEKEIRNSRVMGLFIVFLAVYAFVIAMMK